MILSALESLLVVADAAAQIADPGHELAFGTGVLSVPGLGSI